MNISVQRLLEKMEQELHLAKATVKDESLREKVYSIKILCELILDEKQLKGESQASATRFVQQPLMPVSQPMMPISQPMMPIGQPKKLVVDDEANGDSLFDF